MANKPPYMISVKNLGSILDRIRDAGTPPKFTNEFLRANLGFTSPRDRSVVGVLRHLGFLTADGAPTPRYNEYRDATRSGQAIAQGLREGWADIFLSDQKAYERSSTQLKDLFKNVTGASDAVAEKHAATFKALADRADWMSSDRQPAGPTDEPVGQTEQGKAIEVLPTLQLHSDIHIHLARDVRCLGVLAPAAWGTVGYRDGGRLGLSPLPCVPRARSAEGARHSGRPIVPRSAKQQRSTQANRFGVAHRVA